MNTSKEYNGTCTLCGKRNCKLLIVDEDAHVCEECLEAEYFQCDECKEYWAYDYVEFFHLKDGRTICENCRDDFDDDEVLDD